MRNILKLSCLYSPLSQLTDKSCCGQLQNIHVIDFLDFRNVSFLPSSSIERLFEDLNNIVGQGV